jgi:Ca2+:H+ antiporter
MRWNWMLVFIPIGLGLHWVGASPILVSLTSSLAIVPLARLMSDATAALVRFLGPVLGGLLSATMANAPEIIVSAFALRAGLVAMVKSSLTGSILGNLLLGLGLSFFAGGIRHRRNQRFDSQVARINSALLTLASFGLIIPAVAQYSLASARPISRESAAVLFLLYLASLASIFFDRKPLIGAEGVKAGLKEKAARPDEVSDEPAPGCGRNQALLILVTTAAGLGIMSEVLTGAIEPASASLHLSPQFTGVFLLALVGNAAELVSAVRFACRDQMDLCIGVTVGASVQVGLLVAPVLVFLGVILGQDMNLVFSPFELIAVVMAIYMTRNLIYDGESSWLEGLILIAVYLMFGIGFLHLPEIGHAAAARQ